MDNYKKYLLVACVCVVAFSAGRFSAPKSVTTAETEQQTVDQTKNIDKNQNVVETTKETHTPDGTVVIEKRKERQTTTQTEIKTDIEASKTSTTMVENRPSYRLGIQYEPAIRGFQDSVYTGVVERRLFSEVYLGVTVSSRHTIGLSLSLGF